LLDFFGQFVRANLKVDQLNQSDLLFQQMGMLFQTLVKRFRYPEWFMEMKGYSKDPDDWSSGRLDEHKNFRDQ